MVLLTLPNNIYHHNPPITPLLDNVNDDDYPLIRIMMIVSIKVRWSYLQRILIIKCNSLLLCEEMLERLFSEKVKVAPVACCSD